MYRYYFFKSTKKLILIDTDLGYNLLNHDVGILSKGALSNDELYLISQILGAYYYKVNNSGYRLCNLIKPI